MKKYHLVSKYGFWVVSGILLVAMIIINSLMKSPLSEFGCVVATFIAEVMVWILDVVCFGYKDSTVRLWLSGGVVAIIIGACISVIGGVYIKSFEIVDYSRAWLFMACILSLLYIVSAHHILLAKDSK